MTMQKTDGKPNDTGNRDALKSPLKKQAEDERRQRLASNLRQNLRRRKEQAKARNS